jgi:hypothetical protein
MYSKKEGKVLPKIFLDELERDIATGIARALRSDFQNLKIAAGNLAEINMETLKKWYNGRNTPSAANLVVLARGSPSVRRVLWELIEDNASSRVAVTSMGGKITFTAGTDSDSQKEKAI